MKAKLKIITAMLTWGSMGVIVKQIDLPSGTIAFIRAIIGLTFLFMISLMLKRVFPIKEIIKNKWILLASGSALGANWIFIFEAYKHTTVAIATLSYYIAPILIVILSTILLREKMTLLKAALMMVSLFGLALVSGVFDAHMAAGNSLGILFGFAAAIAYASFTIMNKNIKGLSSMDSTIIQFGVSSLVLLPYILINENSPSININWNTVILLAVLGVFHTGIAFWLFFSAIRELKAQTIAVFSYLDPVTAVLLSAFFLQEELGVYQILGAFIILSSAFISGYIGDVQLVNRRKRNFLKDLDFRKTGNVRV